MAETLRPRTSFLEDAAKRMVQALKDKGAGSKPSLLATEVLERQREEKRRIEGRYGLASTFLGGPRGIGGPASDVARTLLAAAGVSGDPWPGAATTRVTPRAAPPPTEETLERTAERRGEEPEEPARRLTILDRLRRR